MSSDVLDVLTYSPIGDYSTSQRHKAEDKARRAAALREKQKVSPTNSLSDRTNQARLNGRIPDIFGEVRTVPDLLVEPVTVFESGTEVEYGIYCVGNGYFDLRDMKEGNAQISGVQGASVSALLPGTGPWTPGGSEISNRFGPALYDFPFREKQAVRVTSADNQILPPPGSNTLPNNSTDKVRFVWPNIIKLNGASGLRLTDYFKTGDVLSISGSSGTITDGGSSYTDDFSRTFTCRVAPGGVIMVLSYPSGFSAAELDGTRIVISGTSFTTDNGSTINVNGTYFANCANPNRIYLESPEKINSQWTHIDENFLDGYTGSSSITIVKNSIISTTSDFNGTYQVVSVGDRDLSLKSPHEINQTWLALGSLSTKNTGYRSSAVLSTSGNKIIGPFYCVRGSEGTSLLVNLTAPNGISAVSDSAFEGRSVDVTISIQYLDDDGNLDGSPSTTSTTLYGTDQEQKLIGKTINLSIDPNANKFYFTVYRTSSPDESGGFKVQDETHIHSAYVASLIPNKSIGKSTMLLSKTYATSSSAAIKDRKLNCLAMRLDNSKMPVNNFAKALNLACDYLGNLSGTEFDSSDNISKAAAISDYFGSPESIRFNYSFDKSELTFEQIATTICRAGFSSIYRKAEKLLVRPELANENATVLFNSKNKVPGSENRIFEFGVLNEYDGVDFQYIDHDTGLPLQIRIPEDGSALNPKNVESVGITNYRQAYWQAWREFNKLNYQFISLDVEVFEEGELVERGDTVFISNEMENYYIYSSNRILSFLDGELIGADLTNSWTELYLSNEVPLNDGSATDWQIILQDQSEILKSYDISNWLTSSNGNNGVKISSIAGASFPTISIDPNNYARTTYKLVKKTSVTAVYDKFIVSDKQVKGGGIVNLKCYNYSFGYYQNDNLAFWLKFFNGVGSFIDYSCNKLPIVQTGLVTASTARGTAWDRWASSQYITASMPTTIKADFSFNCWFNCTTLPRTSSKIFFVTDATKTVFLYLAPSSTTYSIKLGSNAFSDISGPQLPLNEFHNIGFSKTGSVFEFFVDGVSIGLATISGTIVPSIATMKISEIQIHAYLDEIKLFNRSLSKDEHYFLMNSTDI